MRWAGGVYGSTLCALLADAGFVPSSSPGEQIVFHRGELAIDPFLLVRQYLAGELSAQSWAATWEEAGLRAPLRLAAVS